MTSSSLASGPAVADVVADRAARRAPILAAYDPDPAVQRQLIDVRGRQSRSIRIHPAAADIVEAGDEDGPGSICQRPSRPGAPPSALARRQKADVLQHWIMVRASVAEADILEDDPPLRRELGQRVRLALDLGLVVQHLVDALCRGFGSGEPHRQHADHDQAHQRLSSGS